MRTGHMHASVMWHFEMHENWNTHNQKNEKYRKLLPGTLVNQTRLSWHRHLSGSHLLWAQWHILTNITFIIIYRCWAPGFNGYLKYSKCMVFITACKWSRLLLFWSKRFFFFKKNFITFEAFCLKIYSRIISRKTSGNTRIVLQ